MGGEHSNHMSYVMDLVDPALVTVSSVQSGAWSDPATWDNGVPASGARVRIAMGHTVTVDGEIPENLMTVRSDGHLTFATDVDTTLIADTIIVTSMGSLTMGTAQDPVPAGTTARIVIEDYNGGINAYLNADGTEPLDYDPTQVGQGLISMGAVEMHGAAKVHGGTLAVEPSIGDATLELDFAPTGWDVGDHIAIAGTTRDAEGDEWRTITGINGNTITLDSPLAMDHHTIAHTKAGLVLKVHVINLSRNVYVKTGASDPAPKPEGYDATDNPRYRDYSGHGHVMIMHNNAARIQYAGFYELGRSNKMNRARDTYYVDADGNYTEDSTNGTLVIGTNQRGRYSLHFHHGGFVGTSNVYGCVAESSPGWGFVNHSSHVDFTHNVAYDIKAASFVTEAGDELGSFVENISIKNDAARWHNDEKLQSRKSGDSPNTEFGHSGHGFWFQGINITAQRNVASGAHREAFSVYPDPLALHILHNEFPRALVPHMQDVMGPGQDTISVNATAAYIFEDNTAYGSGTALTVASHRPRKPSELKGFVGWSVVAGFSINYSDDAHYIDATLIGNLDTPDGLANYAHHGSGNNWFIRPHVEGFAVGVQIPRGGNGALQNDPNLEGAPGAFQYTLIEDGYFNNYINLHYPFVRGHRPLTVDIVNPTFGTLSETAKYEAWKNLGDRRLYQRGVLNMDASNTDSNGHGVIDWMVDINGDDEATKAQKYQLNTDENLSAGPYNYFLHAASRPHVPTGTQSHYRDNFLPNRFTVYEANGESYQLFLKQEADYDYTPFGSVAEGTLDPNNLKEGWVASDGEFYTLTDRTKWSVNTIFDPYAGNPWADTAPYYGEGLATPILDSNAIPVAYFHKTNSEINDIFQQEADNYILGVPFLPGDPENYPNGGTAMGGFLLPRNYETLSRFDDMPNSFNVVRMRIDGLDAFKSFLQEPNKAAVDFDFDLAGYPLKYRQDLPAAWPAAANAPEMYQEIDGNTIAYFDGVDDALDFPHPFSISYKTFALIANIRPMDTAAGVVYEWGDSNAGYQIAIENGSLVASLRTSAGSAVELTGGNLVAGQWTQFNLSYNFGHGKAYFYVDGVRVDSADLDTSEDLSNGLARIGWSAGAFSRTGGFHGFVDDLQILERAFTDPAAEAFYLESAYPTPDQTLADLDGDTIIDVNDAFPIDGNESADADGDGFGDNRDPAPSDASIPDADGDWIADGEDSFPSDPNEWSDIDGDGIGDNSDPDIDGDGALNAADDLPLDPNEFVDSDGDGVGDNADQFDADPFEWFDYDNDGVGNNADALVYNPLETVDSDGDGYGDNTDLHPLAANFALEPNIIANLNPGAELDPAGTSDSDKTDGIDPITHWKLGGKSSQGTISVTDADAKVGSQSFLITSGDGQRVDLRSDFGSQAVSPAGAMFKVSGWFKMSEKMTKNDVEIFAITNGDDLRNDANLIYPGGIEWQRFSFEKESTFTSLSYISFRSSTKTTVYLDGISFAVVEDITTDTDGDGIPNARDPDDDGDGYLDGEDAYPLDASLQIDPNGDIDGDGVVNSSDAFPYDATESVDSDGDGIGNNADVDDDNDGVWDGADAFPLDASESVDTDGDGVGNNTDTDDDGDGVLDAEDAFPLDSTESVDTDGDGIGNNADTDDDGDGIPDVDDPNPLVPDVGADYDGDGISDANDSDIDGDGVDNTNDALDYNAFETVDTDDDGWGDNSDPYPDSLYFSVGTFQNHLRNPGGETADNWTFNGGTGSSFSYSTDAFAGSYSIAFTNADGSKATLTGGIIKSLGGARPAVNVSGWVKFSQPYASGEFQLITKFKRASGSNVTETVNIDYPGTGDWYYFSIDYASSTDAYSLLKDFKFRSKSAGLTVQLDELQVVKVEDPSTDTDSDGTPDYTDSDDDNDGYLDGEDPNPLDPLQ
ncbi:MAG: G8 domain-containing protein [Opitutales bacterium]